MDPDSDGQEEHVGSSGHHMANSLQFTLHHPSMNLLVTGYRWVKAIQSPKSCSRNSIVLAMGDPLF